MRLEPMIDRLKSNQNTENQVKPGSPQKPEMPFADVLRDSIRKVNEIQQEADQAIADLATGKNPDIARTMIAVEKANISFQLMTQIRNKIIDAYQEIMRMQV